MRSGCAPAEPYPHGCSVIVACGLVVYTALGQDKEALGGARLWME